MGSAVHDEKDSDGTRLDSTFRRRIRDDHHQFVIAFLPDADIGAFVHERCRIRAYFDLAVIDAQSAVAAHHVVDLVVLEHVHPYARALVQGALAENDACVGNVVEVSVGRRIAELAVRRGFDLRDSCILADEEAITDVPRRFCRLRLG